MHQKIPPQAFLPKPLANKALRRLAAAEGYLQLGMAKHALEELDAIEDAGNCEAFLMFLRGEALRVQKHYEKAVDALQRAAMLLPAPLSQRAWLALAECFQATGQEELARVATQAARSAAAPVSSRPVVQIVLRPVVVWQGAIATRG